MIDPALTEARASATAIREALQRGDSAAALEHQRDLDRNVGTLELAVGASLGLLSGVQQASGGSASEEADAVLASLTDLRQNTDALGQSGADGPDLNAEAQKVAQIEEALTMLETRLSEFQNSASSFHWRPKPKARRSNT